MKAFKGYFRPAASKRRQEPPTPLPSTQIRDAPSPQRQITHGSKLSSSEGSLTVYPLGDFRNSSAVNMLDMKTEMMAQYLWEAQRKKMWSTGHGDEGVMLKKERGSYTCVPKSLISDKDGLFPAVQAMNVRAAMTVRTNFIKIILSRREENDFIPLPNGLKMQVLGQIQDLPRCQKHQFAAFLDDCETLLVWDDDPNHLLERVTHLEEQLLKLIWEGPGDSTDDESIEKPSKAAGTVVTANEVRDSSSSQDVEKGLYDDDRPTRLISAVMVGLTLALLLATLGLGYRLLANEVKTDPSYGIPRLALVALFPIQAWLSLFFFGVCISVLFQIFGPTSQVTTNSKIYSAVPPRRLRRGVNQLPHITIQCPVYKEGLAGVIQPTIMSVKAAISTYEMQGGTASIFVNDDGMQVIREEEAQIRKDFYDEHQIGWVARPKHNSTPAEGERPFHRRGKFKKASNMNYALMITNKVEEKLLHVQRDEKWTQQRETQAYEDCLDQVLVEQEGRAWAGGNIRVGDYILLIDSDTRVPRDCLLDAASEMENSPEVGILQYSSGVMKVTDTFFENGITFFTNLIYTAIKYSVANGDVVPFVGHNAILRWAALQEVVYEDEDGYEKFWSESHVSEDFDMALRLQCLGYTIRFGAYTGEGFKEGVSLTVYDELARWEKYAYGCNELLFHPMRYWLVRGPFTPLFRRFITSNMRLTSKITIMSYIGTYYAIASAWLMTLINFFLMGLLNGTAQLSKYYLDSFKIYVAIVFVFSVMGNIALAVLRFRCSEASFGRALWTNFKWVPLLTIFLGGVSLHITQALLSHMFSIDMTWGATAKEVDTTTTFAREWRKVLREFKGTFVFCALGIAVMVAFSCFVPDQWRIQEFVAIYPFALVVVTHFLLPVCLNPGLMMLRW
ncbi:MAG: hypothetical protein M1817_004356 [Caeruleum heppii]|nr:MAG: hypothetical protein M1817_004356 [Caeruleum heppii]